ncbi:hypothetical protein N7462_003148 [Penicillium macrosclerotiorum]|uniref:uncharacterized protein n=1 Tax=Penicillium macrosclerotiorum TaxID=303699 RepID=UPI00254748CF|nr:uncharacterized protein N7462_003148 [Penicillium macrosclerotiorum]KAJ5688756.1 hypothetical protein N7462_003148 [Penicillium macrosclerotiorum]
MSDCSSIAKKRARDRRAQQTLRDKKLRYTAELEAQVAHCEKYHNEEGVKGLLDSIEALRRQNDTLVARQTSLSSLIRSWEEAEVTGFSIASTIPSFQASTSPSPQAIHLAQSLDPKTLWDKLPLYYDNFARPQSVSCPWFAYPSQIARSPDSPESPLDILYGSKTNPLAAMIHEAIERRPIRDPERLAMGWIAYHFTKWIITPSPDAYERLPLFLRPTQEQFQCKHPLALSCCPWPKMRSNLICQWSRYENCRDEIFGLFACCVKIRWPWGVKILERNEKNELCLKESFYEIFMKEEGWGITQEFINKYPNLVAGMDVDSLVYNITFD